jgi:hypothetical protein
MNRAARGGHINEAVIAPMRPPRNKYKHARQARHPFRLQYQPQRRGKTKLAPLNPAASRRPSLLRNWTPALSSKIIAGKSWRMSISKTSRADDQRPSCSAKTKRADRGQRGEAAGPAHQEKLRCASPRRLETGVQTSSEGRQGYV